MSETENLQARVAVLEAQLARSRAVEQQHRETAAALQLSQLCLHNVVNNAPIVMWAVDRQGIFTLSEGQGLEGLGLHAGQAVGQQVFELFRENSEIEQHIRRALAGEEVLAEVLVRERWFQGWYAPKRDSVGSVVGARRGL